MQPQQPLWIRVLTDAVLLVGYIVATSKEGIAQDCDASLLRHIYHADRLEVISECVTVPGVVVAVRPERDGDFHICLSLAPRYKGLLNAGNMQRQGGTLVVEPICARRVTQEDAKAACAGFQNQVPTPQLGQKVVVTGVHVLDRQHGWMEIHPVTRIVAVQ